MKTRMEHILEITKALCTNQEVNTNREVSEFRARSLINFAYHLYDKIEEREEKINKASKVE